MFNFNDKSWWKSKTFWTAVCTFMIGGAEAAGISVPPYLVQMLMGFGLYSLRDAIK